jgi:2-methylcitrate dehydratase PrpD
VIGAWAAALEWNAIPESSRLDAKLRLLDSLGLMMVGQTTEAGTAARRMTEKLASIALTGSKQTGEAFGPSAEALLNGTLAHCRDYDDTFSDSVVHPGSVIVPTALALAQSCDSTAEDFGAAVVAGYEVAARIGSVFGRRLGAQGFHATGVVGPVAAAVTAGRLMRLDGDRIASAIGLACSMSGGLNAFISDGSWSKWLHAGWSAHSGVVSASLAAEGFRGPKHVLDGPHNLFSSFVGSVEFDRSGLTLDLGHQWAGAKADFKYYPCAHVIQPYIDAALAILQEHKLSAADVSSVVCVIAPWAAAVVAEPRPAKLKFGTEMEAIASLPYQVAIALLDRQVDLRSLDQANRDRADVFEMANRVTHLSDPGLGKSFDGRIELVTKGGQLVAKDTRVAEPEPQRVIDKFLSNYAISAAAQSTPGHCRPGGLGPGASHDPKKLAHELISSSALEWRQAAAIVRRGL